MEKKDESCRKQKILCFFILIILLASKNIYVYMLIDIILIIWAVYESILFVRYILGLKNDDVEEYGVSEHTVEECDAVENVIEEYDVPEHTVEECTTSFERNDYCEYGSSPQKKSEYNEWAFAIECNAYVVKQERMEEQEEMMKMDEERSLASGKKPDLEENAVHRELDPNFDAMSGVDFENFCMDLLKRNGYKNVHGTKTSGDQGIDILAEKDDIRYGIQCKCYSGSVGNASVQQAFSGKSFYNCHVAVVMTNSNFTQSAVELANKNNVLLWEKTKLLELNSELSENY